MRRRFAPGTCALGTSPLPTGCTRRSVDPSAWHVPSDGPRRWGIRRHVQIAPWTDYVEVHWAPGAEAYVTPVADDCVGIAILTSRRGGFDCHLDEFAALKDRLHGHPHGTDRPQARCGRKFGAERPGGCCWWVMRRATSTR